MPTFLFLNQQRRVRLIWPCVMAVLGCMIFTKALAQNTSATTSGGMVRQGEVTTSGATNDSPTYLRDIQPIFMGNCSSCHNQQSRFVYNWLDYKTAYSDRWEIRRRVWDSWKGFVSYTHLDVYKRQPSFTASRTFGPMKKALWRKLASSSRRAYSARPNVRM